MCFIFFVFKQKTAYEMRISNWSSDVCSSDLLPAGTQGALLYGDPTKEGPFLLRLKMPAGYKIPPHSHPRPEIVTVISGAFHVGMGETADAAKRSEARRVGKEWVSTCSSRWSPYH